MNNLHGRRVSVLALTFSASLALGGCAALALPMLAPLLGGGSSGLVKAGTEYAKNGTVYRTFSAPFDHVRLAMLDTFQRLDVKVLEEDRDWDTGILTIRGAAYDRKVTLALEPVTPGMTRVQVKVGKGWGRDQATASEIVTQAELSVEPPSRTATARR